MGLTLNVLSVAQSDHYIFTQETESFFPGRDSLGWVCSYIMKLEYTFSQKWIQSPILLLTAWKTGNSYYKWLNEWAFEYYCLIKKSLLSNADLNFWCSAESTLNWLIYENTFVTKKPYFFFSSFKYPSVAYCVPCIILGRDNTKIGIHVLPNFIL